VLSFPFQASFPPGFSLVLMCVDRDLKGGEAHQVKDV
jgi:hypothetical protein